MSLSGRAKMALAPGQWAASRALSFMVAVVLASRWSVRRREMACRWRVAASGGWEAARPVAVGAQVRGQLGAGAGVGGGRGRPRRGRAAWKLWGGVGTTGWPA